MNDLTLLKLLLTYFRLKLNCNIILLEIVKEYSKMEVPLQMPEGKFLFQECNATCNF